MRERPTHNGPVADPRATLSAYSQGLLGVTDGIVGKNDNSITGTLVVRKRICRYIKHENGNSRKWLLKSASKIRKGVCELSAQYPFLLLQEKRWHIRRTGEAITTITLAPAYYKEQTWSQDRIRIDLSSEHHIEKFDLSLSNGRKRLWRWSTTIRRGLDLHRTKNTKGAVYRPNPTSTSSLKDHHSKYCIRQPPQSHCTNLNSQL